MGLLFLAAWLRKFNPGVEVRIIDSNWEDPLKVLLCEPWDICGITSMTGQYEKASNLARLLRTKRGIGPIILGGVHISTAPLSLRPEFDYSCLGEGEQWLSHFIQTGESKSFSPISLKDYPDLDYRLLNPRYFQRRPIRTWQASVTEAMIITSRGCPYHCRFCSTTAFWQTYRTHEVDWVIRQWNHLADLGVTHLQVYDDLFTVSKPRLREIATAFEAAGLRRKIQAMGAMSRANIIDDEICDLLKSMNFKIVSFGFESGSDRVLKYLKKSGCGVDLNRQAVITAKRKGLRVVGSLMLGNPTEAASDMFRTIRFILWFWWRGGEDIWPFVLSPYPGTEFWELAKSKGKASDKMDNWNSLTIHSKRVGPAKLCEIPRWQFVPIWYLAQAALLPFKLMKAFKMAKSWLAGLFQPASPVPSKQQAVITG
jgi:radical SAM superfamily enzyme YgiQ (UPF0313 family)